MECRQLSIRRIIFWIGSVISANIITDRDSKRSRGFGFVELESGGPEAIEAMNDSDLEGRKLTVNEAKPRT